MQPSRDRGQALVEFALVVPVFMLMLAGMIQLGVILWASNTLNQVTRDTGRYAATLDCSAAAATRAEGVFRDPLLADSGGPWKSSTATVDVAYLDAAMAPTSVCPDDNQDTGWVTVDASMEAFVFFPWLPGNGVVSSSTTFRVEPAP
ncbi:MAG TPA: TadE family protein [Candidatus Limnocylindrales bacterium]|jgi:Flp pilus assembly protein TadG|nr:TadE family protein [Candidatus Limnocylindrales bacterium]